MKSNKILFNDLNNFWKRKNEIESQNSNSRDLPIKVNYNTEIFSVTLGSLIPNFGSEWIIFCFVEGNIRIKTIRLKFNETFDEVIELLKGISRLKDLNVYRR